MSQNTLKVHDLNEDAEFDENGVEVFDEKALVDGCQMALPTADLNVVAVHRIKANF